MQNTYTYIYIYIYIHTYIYVYEKKLDFERHKILYTLVLNVLLVRASSVQS